MIAQCQKRMRDQQQGGAGAQKPGGAGGGGGGGKPKAKAKGKAAAKSPAFKGNCNRCGRPGHMKKDCRAKTHVSGKQLGSLEEADQPEVEEPSSQDFGGLFFNSFEKLQPAASGGGGVSSQYAAGFPGPANTPSLSEAAGGDGVGVGGGDNGGCLLYTSPSPRDRG